MRHWFWLAAALFAGDAVAATPACRPDTSGRIDLQRCAVEAPPGSPERALALMNLGTAAFQRGDYTTAVKLYDAAAPTGDQRNVYSDPLFHAYRGYAYRHVGRKQDALEEARTAYLLLQQPAIAAQFGPAGTEQVLAHILLILKEGGDPSFEPAKHAFLTLPARDWVDYGNRAAVLIEMDDLEGALAANASGLMLSPGEPQLLNNACYAQTLKGDPKAALPFCEQAVTAAPNVAPIRHSYAEALARLGRCAQSEEQLEEARRLDPASAVYDEPIACAADGTPP